METEDGLLVTKCVTNSNASTFSCHLVLVLMVSTSLLPSGTEEMIYNSNQEEKTLQCLC